MHWGPATEPVWAAQWGPTKEWRSGPEMAVEWWAPGLASLWGEELERTWVPRTGVVSGAVLESVWAWETALEWVPATVVPSGARLARESARGSGLGSESRSVPRLVEETEQRSASAWGVVSV
jgi:hypothetical protein